jgi:hypothetical protein
MESGDSDAAPMILTNEVSRAFLSLGYHNSERDKKTKGMGFKKIVEPLGEGGTQQLDGVDYNR